MIVVVMGVSGAGKTTIGKLLAARLGCEFLDGDDFHPPQNIARMAAGTPLTDLDRRAWLECLNEKLKEKESIVLACSALKQAYRDRLVRGLSACRFVHLRGSVELIRARLKERRHRYMPASLLESQFAALEPPLGAVEIDVELPLERCVEDILAKLA